MEKKPRFYHNPKDRFIYIDGAPYQFGASKMKKIDGVSHIAYIPLIKASKKDRDENLDFVAENLKKIIPEKKLLKQVLSEKLGTEDIKKIRKAIEAGKTIKRQDGCLGIKIGTGKKKDGGDYVQLFD